MYVKKSFMQKLFCEKDLSKELLDRRVYLGGVLAVKHREHGKRNKNNGTDNGGSNSNFYLFSADAEAETRERGEYRVEEEHEDDHLKRKQEQVFDACDRDVSEVRTVHHHDSPNRAEQDVHENIDDEAREENAFKRELFAVEENCVNDRGGNSGERVAEEAGVARTDDADKVGDDTAGDRDDGTRQKRAEGHDDEGERNCQNVVYYRNVKFFDDDAERAEKGGCHEAFRVFELRDGAAPVFARGRRKR